MKYRNLVYIKHPEENRRSFLYELPLDADINGGEKLLVSDKRGEHVGVATSPNFYASDKMTKMLCECNGGYFPPAKVVGKVSTVTIRQEIVDRYEVTQETSREEENPWVF